MWIRLSWPRVWDGFVQDVIVGVLGFAAAQLTSDVTGQGEC